MTADDQPSTRADWARWFLFRDEPDEAARVLEPGDELELARSDYLDLAAALSRRGLTATYEGGRAVVRSEAQDPAADGRKPPLRAPAGSPALAKKTA
jgi:hypothetical protein